MKAAYLTYHHFIVLSCNKIGCPNRSFRLLFAKTVIMNIFLKIFSVNLVMMRKSSSEFRRPSLSGAPLRVRQENLPSHGSRSSSMERASSSSTKLPVSKRMSSTSSSQQYRPRQSSMGRGNIPDLRKSSSMSQNSFLPKSG